MPRKGGKRKKTRTHVPPAPANAQVIAQEQADIPRSIVAKLGKTETSVADLVVDLRHMMEPYTARNLKERNYNRVKDYVSVAGPLGISHLLVTSQSKANINLRIARIPAGPTLHFRITKYILSREVKSQQKRPYESHAAYLTPPVVVLNNFNQAEQEHVKLMRVTFQHLFPTINVKNVHLRECRRVVLFHYNKEDDTVELRHYAIKANPVGISKGIKRIVQSRLPNLGKLQDIAEFLQGSEDGSIAPGASFTGSMSDSEAEDEGSRVTLPEQFIGRGNVKSQMSAMKLIELGPRISLELFKVEQQVNEGDILYHKFVQKTAEEAAKNKEKVQGQKLLKEQRRNEQNENVKRKRDALEVKRQEREEKKRRRLEAAEPRKEGDAEDEEEGDDDEDDDEEGEYDQEDGDNEGEDDDEGEADGEDDEEEEEEEGDDEEEEEEEEA